MTRFQAPRRTLGMCTAALLVAVLVGCGGDSGDGESSVGSQPTQPTQPTQPATSQEPTEEPSGSAAGEAPDFCEVFTADDFASVTGSPAGGPPEQGLVAGAARGGCTYSGEAGFPMIMISAYDAGDREATLSMVDSEPVEGLDVEADWADETGLLVVVDGADWYFQVVATGDGMGFDQARSVEAAKIVLENL